MIMTPCHRETLSTKQYNQWNCFKAREDQGASRELLKAEHIINFSFALMAFVVHWVMVMFPVHQVWPKPSCKAQ